jgi:hypothetical protein
MRKTIVPKAKPVRLTLKFAMSAIKIKQSPVMKKALPRISFLPSLSTIIKVTMVPAKEAKNSPFVR